MSKLDYSVFLEQRRKLMATGISARSTCSWRERRRLVPRGAPSPAALEHLVNAGESSTVELKSSLRADTPGKGIPPKVLEDVSLEPLQAS